MQDFISGLEEIVARLVALVTTMLITIAYTLGNPFNQPKWQEIALFVLGFWFAYEVIGYILFRLFKFFAAKKNPATSTTNTEIDTPTDNNPNISIN